MSHTVNTANSTSRASNGHANFFKQMRANIVKIIAPSGLTTDELSLLLGLDISKIFDEALETKFAAEIAKSAKATADTLIANNFRQLTAETLSALVIANAMLSELQKSQICAIVNATATKDTPYIR